MASAPLIDLSTLDLNRLIVTRDQVYERLPHRFEFMQLDGLVHIDKVQGLGVALRDIREDEFWVKGHIPGRPIFPGVLMIESAAQMASYLAVEVYPYDRFLGFGGLDDVKFRSSVAPPAKMYIVEKVIEARPRRTICAAQGFVDGKLTFEAIITGMPV